MNLAPPFLLTVDEARDLLAGSAIAFVDAVECRPERVAQLLVGAGTLVGLPAPAAGAVRAHWAALRRVVAVGHAWIVDDELAGVASYAGLGELGPAVVAV